MRRMSKITWIFYMNIDNLYLITDYYGMTLVLFAAVGGGYKFSFVQNPHPSQCAWLIAVY